MTILSPFFEECIFRVAIPKILQDLGIGQICIISSGIFALTHLSNIVITGQFIKHIGQMIFTFVLGIIIYQTESFYIGVFYHVYYNISSIGLYHLWTTQIQKDIYVCNDDMCCVYVMNRSKSADIPNSDNMEGRWEKSKIIGGESIAIERRTSREKYNHMTDLLRKSRERRNKDKCPIFI